MENKFYRSNILIKSDEELLNIISHYWGMSTEDLNKPFKVIATYNKSAKKILKDKNMDILKMSGI